MIRYGMGFLIAAGACAFMGVTACGTSKSSTGGAGGATSAGGADGGGAVSSTDGGGNTKCEGACCPTDPSCYSTSSGNGSPGSECLATRDNTLTPKRIQMRNMWVNPTSPAGLQESVVYQTLNAFTTIPDSTCGLSGDSGYIELVDFDLNAGTSRVGFSTLLQTLSNGSSSDTVTTSVQNSLKNGLCMATASSWTGSYKEASGSGSLGISQLYVAGQGLAATLPPYPVGLTNPMPQPWNVAPAFAKRLPVDFDLTAAPNPAIAPEGADAGIGKYTTQREQILARLDKTTGDLGKQGFTGVFFYDDTTKQSHGYSPVGWQILYDTLVPTAYELIPIREAEINSTFNDPAHPNCVGTFHGDALATVGCAPGGATTNTTSAGPSNPWGSATTIDGTAPGVTKGYFLIAELEQIWSNVLSQTLCYLYPTPAVSIAGGWGTSNDARCRVNPKWNAMDPVNGMPTGDWCSSTDTAAHGDCHDAYRTIAYQAFAATNIADGTCDVQSTTGTPTGN